MATLLTIPYDIRAIILDLVLFTPADRTTGSRDFHHEALKNQGAFLTDRQLRSQSKDRLSHHQPLTYYLDIQVPDENNVTALWTSVPLVAKHVPIIKTTITATGGCRQNVGWTEFDGGSGGPPPTVWKFYELMQQFMRHNPQGKQIDHTIGHLAIDVQTPHLKLNQRFYQDDRPRWYRRRNTANLDPNVEYVVTAEYLADFLGGFMGMLLAMTYHTASYGAFLYASIGSISISVDGEVKHSWNLGGMLASFPENGPVEAFSKGRDRDWREFYASTIKSRREHGLHVQERSDAKE